jgi:hypothetical protein
MKIRYVLSLAVPILLSSCSMIDGLSRAQLVDQRLDVRDGKELLTRKYLVDQATGRTVTETLEVRSDVFTGMAAVLRPKQPSTLTRDQVVRALAVAIRRSSLELPQRVDARAAFYTPVSHLEAVQPTVVAPSTEAAQKAIGVVSGRRKGGAEGETFIVYLDPVNGACLVDAVGKRVEWTSMERVESAQI